jgi:hypothetical protein
MMRLNTAIYLDSLVQLDNSGKHGLLVKLRTALLLERYGFKLEFEEFCKLARLVGKHKIKLSFDYVLNVYRLVSKAEYLGQQLEKG